MGGDERYVEVWVEYGETEVSSCLVTSLFICKALRRGSKSCVHENNCLQPRIVGTSTVSAAVRSTYYALRICSHVLEPAVRGPA